MRINLPKAFGGLLGLLVTTSCGPTPAPAPAPRPPQRERPRAQRARPAAPAKTVVKTTLAKVGLDAAALDRKIDPCGDFYRFACGGWIAQTKIPADRSRWVRSFNVIHRRNERVLKAILEKEAATPSTPRSGAWHKIGAYYRACMATKEVQHAGLKPLRSLLRQVSRVRSRKQLAGALATLHRYRVWALFSVHSEQDYVDATKVIGVLTQAGLGLPDRDYYLRKGTQARALLASYRTHVERMLRLGGLSNRRARAGARDVLKIETALAKASLTRVERRDPWKRYHRVDRAGLRKQAPKVGWASYFEQLGFPGLRAISVSSLSYFQTVSKLVATLPPRQWQSYLRWQVLHALAPLLPKRFVDEAFVLAKLLTGQKTQRPRWKRCVAATDDALGEALAQPYVKQRFSAESRAAAKRFVLAISKVFGKRVGGLDWMDAKTRTRALAKLRKMAYLIGYPSKWKPYDFKIGTVYATNALASRAYELKRELGRVGKPVDRGRWEMSPPTVNAYYHPNKNQMVFPAGILQPPFYSANASIAVNLGAMGMVVGHELTHGFDDQGAKFDARGNLRNWWEKATAQRFKKRTRCVVDQYAGYEPLPGVKLSGKLTAGENIADLGGIKLAYRAYRLLRAKARSTQVADGFTEDQQFFLAYAQIWCAKIRPAEVRRRAKVDPHSPPQFRVNGPLRNFGVFARAFRCKRGTPMRPKKTCRVW